MKKIIILSCLMLLLNGCYKLPKKEEIEYRNKLENALVNTFPKKVTVVIHPFNNLSKQDTNRAYLENAIPDNIEAMLEPIRSTLAYIPFDGMPFYVSAEISNIFQTVEPVNTNTNQTNSSSSANTNNSNTNYNESYFNYLTNYLLLVPTQETQYNANTTTNTNYSDYITNFKFENGVEVTNITTNEILSTTTNSIDTNIVIVNKNILTPTNMLMLLYEEFPELTNYLSFLPIEIRRAGDSDIEDLKDYQLKLNDPQAWKAAQNKKKTAKNSTTNTNSSESTTTQNTNNKDSEYPEQPFEYIYHISGNFRTRQSQNLFTSVNTSIQLLIYPPISTGNNWWEEKYNQQPPKLSSLLALAKTLDTNNSDMFKSNSLRTPFKKPAISPRLKDEFETYSTNFRDSRPETPENDINSSRKGPLKLQLNTSEKEIPIAMMEWLKYFHANIINRPYTVLQINTTPNNTLVYLNGFYIGITPLTYPTAPIGQQRITFIKDGFNREEILTDIVANRTNRISYSLQSLTNSGIISITASIPDAEIYINSQYKGKTPLIVSNLSLNQKYRVEILNPQANLTSNRNSVYKQFTLTEKKPSINFDAQFKSYETSYKPPNQKALLAATYISWLTTVGLLGAGIYTQARQKEAEDLIFRMGTPTTPAEAQKLAQYTRERNQFAIASQATLYSSIAAAIISSGIMGWYLYSKEVYLGFNMDPEKKEWYANFKLKF